MCFHKWDRWNFSTCLEAGTVERFIRYCSKCGKEQAKVYKASSLMAQLIRNSIGMGY